MRNGDVARIEALMSEPQQPGKIPPHLPFSPSMVSSTIYWDYTAHFSDNIVVYVHSLSTLDPLLMAF